MASLVQQLAPLHIKQGYQQFGPPRASMWFLNNIDKLKPSDELDVPLRDKSSKGEPDHLMVNLSLH